MSTGKLYIRGTISNSLAAAILYCVCRIAEGQLRKYVAVAVAVQLLVFLIHGLPHRSEKFYDLSGSITHFLVVSSSLLREPKVRSVRQVTTALASTVWMTRLGTFLFLRINRDGKDERFAAITPVWLSFLGAWMLQAAWVVLTQLPVILMNEVGASTSAASGMGLSTLEETPLGLLDAACAITWLVGFYVEFTADLEKFTFRGEAKNRDKFISSGLWAMCRHPNCEWKTDSVTLPLRFFSLDLCYSNRSWGNYHVDSNCYCYKPKLLDGPHLFGQS